MNLKEEKCYVGIDISKEYLDVYILPLNKYMQFKNNAKEIQKLIKKLEKLAVDCTVMEATGGYEKKLVKVLAHHNLSPSVVNPRQIRNFAKSIGKLAKTDYIDAHTIAMFAERIKPRQHLLLTENQEDLAKKTSRRRQLIDMVVAEKNRKESADKEEKKSINRVIKCLEKEIKLIDEEINKKISSDLEIRQKKEILESVKGIGSTIASNLIADLPELDKLDSRKISALAGVAPYNYDSGAMKGKRAIWGGRVTVRSALYMAALVATRHNKKIRDYYQKLCKLGKPKKVALVACMRKLLTIINVMIYRKETWNEALI